MLTDPLTFVAMIGLWHGLRCTLPGHLWGKYGGDVSGRSHSHCYLADG